VNLNRVRAGEEEVGSESRQGVCGAGVCNETCTVLLAKSILCSD